MKPKFEPTEDGLEVIDRIERHRDRLTTHEPVSPRSVDPAQIQYPVDAAVEITTSAIAVSVNTAIYIRDTSNNIISEYDTSKQVSLQEDEYTLDLSGSLKLYMQFESSVYIYSDTEHIYITLDDSTRVLVGARSYHTRPAGTITTTADPINMMEVISTFGSALKTTTAERSYPTLRGHPPTITVGDELTIPDGLERPDTGVRIEIPATLSHIFIAAPLAYYLGAEVVPRSKPQLATTRGYTYALDDEGYETAIKRVLNHVFFLDCIVRTEGTTPLPVHERRTIESELTFDVQDAYEQPLTEQLETYLETPFDLVEPFVPDWQLEAQLEPDEGSIEFLPFISNNLAAVTVSESGQTKPDSPPIRNQTEAIEDFIRGPSATEIRASRGTEDSFDASNQSDIRTIRQTWQTANSSKLSSTTSVSAFYNSIGRTPKEDPIKIEVICNDPDMDEELETVNEVYQTRDELPFDVTIHHNLTTAELEQTLSKESDFVHYIGHIDERGFECSDGKLDSSRVEYVGAKAFLLNACQSYDQGLQLVEAGSLGGIVTLDDVVNSGAISVGSTVANLLNKGFPLYAALDIARQDTIVGEQYRIVGDGITTIAQSKSGAPTVCLVENVESGINLRIEMYASAERRKGSLFTPHLESIDSYYLLPGRTNQITVTKSQLRNFFAIEDMPVLLDGEVRWSGEIATKEL